MSTALVAALGVALLVVTVLALRFRTQLHALRSAVDEHLLIAAAASEEGSLADVPDRFDRLAAADEATHRAALRHEDTEMLQTLLAESLDALDQGVVIVDRTGEVLHRNVVAATLSDAKHSDVLVPSTLEEVLREALLGVAQQRTLELFGPPPRTVVLRGIPLARPASAGEDLVGALGLVEDVTERQRLESVRRDFVANISHELRTPVGALGVLAEAMADADDPDTASRLAERMADQVARVTRTIQDLLELSRIEGGEDRVTGEVDVADVVQEAVERARPVAESAGIDLIVVPAVERLDVSGDGRQLVSALFNLLDNAIKYSDADTSVEVRTARDEDAVAISVVDHGIGIPAADLERVFERFYRVDAARSRTTGGTGLGLAIVRHVVVNHGGDVQVRSRAGEGSTFTLRLPAAHRAATAAEVS